MTQTLTAQLENLIDRIDRSSDTERPALAAELEDVSTRLEAMGASVPASVRTRAQEILDEAVEDRFDNLPL